MNDQISPANDDRPLVLAVVGPTCSGKTALSIALAQSLGGEIVACDSRTIYKYMDIGTAKPSHEEQAGIAHHMLDVVEPSEIYTVAQYKDAAANCISEILQRGAVPIVCGGTGFYARALLEGLAIPSVPPQHELRAELNALADREGNSVLHDKLRQLDEVTAAKLSQNDRFRVIRALEVSLVAGKPFSDLIAKQPVPYRIIWMGLNVGDRANLKTYIEKRLDVQMQSGLLDEVQNLLHKYGTCHTLMNSVNYREFIDFFEGKFSFDDALVECVRHNYQLARRQLIWFRANKEINWFNVDEIPKNILLEQSLQLLKKSA